MEGKSTHYASSLSPLWFMSKRIKFHSKPDTNGVVHKSQPGHFEPKIESCSHSIVETIWEILGAELIFSITKSEGSFKGRPFSASLSKRDHLLRPASRRAVHIGHLCGGFKPFSGWMRGNQSTKLHRLKYVEENRPFDPISMHGLAIKNYFR